MYLNGCETCLHLIDGMKLMIDQRDTCIFHGRLATKETIVIKSDFGVSILYYMILETLKSR